MRVASTFNSELLLAAYPVRVQKPSHTTVHALDSRLLIQALMQRCRPDTSQLSSLLGTLTVFDRQLRVAACVLTAYFVTRLKFQVAYFTYCTLHAQYAPVRTTEPCYAQKSQNIMLKKPGEPKGVLIHFPHPDPRYCPQVVSEMLSDAGVTWAQAMDVLNN